MCRIFASRRIAQIGTEIEAERAVTAITQTSLTTELVHDPENDGKPVLVLLHGGAMSSSSMRLIADRLPGYNCLIPDLRGHGTNRALPFLGLEQCADNIASHIAEKTSGPVHLFGLSLGGYVVLQLLARQAVPVQTAVISGVALAGIGGAGWLGRIVDIVYPLLGLKIVRMLAFRMAGIRDARLINDANGQGWAYPSTVRDLGHAVLRAAPVDLRNRNTARTLYLAGTKEVAAVRNGIAAIPLDSPREEARLVVGGTHGWCLQNPDLAACVIDAWVKGRPLPAELIPHDANKREKPRRENTDAKRSPEH